MEMFRSKNLNELFNSNTPTWVGPQNYRSIINDPKFQNNVDYVVPQGVSKDQYIAEVQSWFSRTASKTSYSSRLQLDFPFVKPYDQGQILADIELYLINFDDNGYKNIHELNNFVRFIFGKFNDRYRLLLSADEQKEIIDNNNQLKERIANNTVKPVSTTTIKGESNEVI